MFYLGREKISLRSQALLLFLCLGLPLVDNRVFGFAEQEQVKQPTNPIELIYLETVSIQLTDDRRDFSIPLEGLRSGRYYEMSVEIKNNSTSPFLPVNSKASCSCLVGVVQNEVIAVGGKGIVKLRFRPKYSETTLSQFAVVEGKGVAPLKLGLQGSVTPEFILDKNVLRMRQSAKSFSLQFTASYQDVNIESIVASSSSFLFDVTKVQHDVANNRALVIVELTEDLVRRDSFADAIVLSWSEKGTTTKVHSQQFNLSFESDLPSVKPKLVSMVFDSKNQEIVGTLKVYNAGSCHKDDLNIGSEIKLRIAEQTVHGEILAVGKEKYSLSVNVKFANAFELKSLFDRTRLVDCSIELASGVRLDDLRCVLADR